jgi:hypothetical protein
MGLYRSTVSGTVFAAMSTSATINLMGWNSNGTDVGGQGWYDLCIAANPLNKDEIVVGGVNVWRSLDGGSNWSIYGHWTGSLAPFTHADQHCLSFAPNGTLFNTNDGTVYRRTTTMTGNKWITGHQDNGTSTWNGTSYQARIGGDGMDCFIDRTNDNNVFGSTQNGGFQRSTTGGTSWSGATTGLTGTAPWLTIWKQDPVSSTRVYAGRQDLFVSNNLAANWSTLTPLPASGGIVEFAIAPSNNNVIYVLKSGGIYKTTNAGTTWSTVTNGVPVASAQPKFIAIDPTDANNAWVVLSGYSSGNKVFMTANGGSTWTNVSGNLPNIPANCVVYQPGTNDLIYVGMDVGVYYLSNTSTSWTLYNAGLPNVPVVDLEITGVNNGIMHAATYGRGVWSVSLYTPAGAPNSAFAFPSDYKCVATSITFSDQSQNSPTSWTWSVTPSAGVIINSPTSQNPTITFPTAGSYTISMQAGNSLGQGSVTTQVFIVANPPVVNISILSPNVCLGTTVQLGASGATSYTWSNGGGTANTATFYPSAISVFSVAGMSNSCTVVKTVTVNANPLPQVSITGAQNVCPGDAVSLTANGAINYTWSSGTNGATFTQTITATTNFSVVGADANGCENIAFANIGVFPLPNITAIASSTMICMNEEIVLTANGATNYQWLPGGQAGSTLAISPLSNVVFTVTGVDNNNCQNTAAITVSVALCEGLAESGQLAGVFSVFPNPTKNKVNLRALDNRDVDARVELFDVTGKLILTQNLHFNGGGQSELNLERYQVGTYYLKVYSVKGNSETFRVIKD